MSAKKISDNFFHVGVQNEKLRVFGDEKVALIETVKEAYCEEMLNKIASVLGDRPVDYVIHNHTEPDHSGSCLKVLERYPNAEVLSSRNGLTYLQQIVNDSTMKMRDIDQLEDKKLDLGGDYVLEFFHAPFLHWPDSMFTYCRKLNALLPCDFLGSHYSFPELIDSEMSEKQVEEWFDAFEYYYACIFGPFKTFASEGLEIIDKIENEIGEIHFVGTSHGPILTKELIGKAREYYEVNSGLGAVPEDKFDEKVAIAYVSAYGYTGEMATAIGEGVEAEGLPVKLFDVTFSDSEEVAQELQTSRGLLFGTATILGDALPTIYTLLTDGALNPIIHRGQVAGSFGSYGWSGEGATNIDERLQQLKFKLPLEPLKVNFRPSENDIVECVEFGKNFAKAVKGEDINLRKKELIVEDDLFDEVEVLVFNDGVDRDWVCVVCSHVEKSVNQPESRCVVCSAEPNAFELREMDVQSVTIGDLSLSQCTVCMYEHSGEVPDVCPVCGSTGDIWKVLEEGGTLDEGTESGLWECEICKFNHEGDADSLPEQCPVCSATGDIWNSLSSLNATIDESELWECEICKFNHEGDADSLPEQCPVCSATGDFWNSLSSSSAKTVSTGSVDFDGSVAIIGGGIAGVSAVETFAKLATNPNVTLFSAEGLPYVRPNICKQSNILEIHDREWYEENGVSLIEAYVERVDNFDGKFTITSRDGETVQGFDNVLLTSGAYARKFYDDERYGNMFSIHTKEDSLAIVEELEIINRTEVTDPINMVFIGAGAVGIEFASYLNDFEDHNFVFTFVDVADCLLSQIPSECSILQHAFEEKGVFTELSQSVSDFVLNEEEDRIIEIVLDDGRRLPVDIAFQCVGIVPEVGNFGESLGLETNEKTQAISVNSKMETNVKNVYAAGVVAHIESYPLVMNNWGVASTMGEIAAKNILGEDSDLDNVELNFACDAFGVSVFGIADVLAEERGNINTTREDDMIRLGFDDDEMVSSIYQVSKHGVNQALVGKCLKKNVFRVLKGLQHFLK